MICHIYAGDRRVSLLLVHYFEPAISDREILIATMLAIFVNTVKKYLLHVQIVGILERCFQSDAYFLFYGKNSRENYREKRYSRIVSGGSLHTFFLGVSIHIIADLGTSASFFFASDEWRC